MKQKILKHFSGNYKLFFGKYLPETKQIGGNECQALCPFHNDTVPSFNFDALTGRYFCHGCGKKGDIFHFYGKVNGLDTKRDFGKILKGIADDFGIPWELSAIMVNEGQVFKLNDVERDGADQTEISSGYEFILKGTIRSRHRFDHRLDKIYHLHCS